MESDIAQIDCGVNDFENDPLECFVEKPTTRKETNPFYVSAKDVTNNIVYVNPIRDTLSNVATLNSTHFPVKSVLVMCLKNGEKPCYDIYNDNVTADMLGEIYKHYCLVRCSTKILKTPSHMKSMLVVGKDILCNVSHPNIELRDYEIIVPMFEVNCDTVMTYVNMYKTVEYDYNKLIEVIELKKFFGASYKISFDFVENILNDYFWKYDTNEFNMTKCIQRRKLKKYMGDQDVDQIQMDYQFNPLSQSRTCNIYTAMKSASDRKYFVKDPTYQNLGLDKETVTKMFLELNDRRSIYNLFNAFAVSKQHCHLVVNNADVMRMMTPFFKRYPQTYINVLTYPMMSMYIEECIFGTSMLKNYRYAITIDTAHEFPVFPFTKDDVHMSPYNVLPVPQTYFTDNLYGLRFIDGYKHYGIDTLDGFRRKFNLFTTRTATKNIFDGINWNVFAVTGSTIPACVPKRSPLVDTVSHIDAPYDDQYLAYFDKYYGNSDVDVVCTSPTLQEFFDETYKLVVQVKKNLSLEENDDKIIITPVKMSRIFIHRTKLSEFLEELYITHPEIRDINNVEKHLNDNDVIHKFFYDKYVQFKMQKYEKVEATIPTHQQYLDVCTSDHFKVCIVSYNIQDNTGASDCIYMETKPDPNNTSPTFQKNIVTLKVEETIRFKVSDNPNNTSKLLLRPFEVFRSRDGSEAFSTVSRFHLPCVRGYYDGTNVYMTPSCVMSHLTYMNLDYNYFAGSQQPIDIVLKYLGRGYGVYLNRSELTYVNITCAGKPQYSTAMREQKTISNPLYGGIANAQYTYVNSNAIRTVDGAKRVFDDAGNITPFKSWTCDEIWRQVNSRK